MQITKEQIIEVLTNNHDTYMDWSGDGTMCVPKKHWNDVADEILTLLQSNDASQPNGSKPDVSGALPPVIEIEFGNHLYAKINLQDGVKVLNVVNGWGDKVDLDLVKVRAAMTD